MSNQAMVVGVGMFGMSLAKALASRQWEVICVDKNEDAIQRASEFATEALVVDATDEEALAELRPERRDLCICAIGEDARDASIVSTALLVQLGARYVVARGYDRNHERILRMVGAHEVVNPERAFGERLAARLAFRGVLDQIPLGTDLEVTEVAAPRAFVGSTLRRLELPRNHGVFVVALRAAKEGEEVRFPEPDTQIEAGDVLVLVGRKGSVQKMMENL